MIYFLWIRRMTYVFALPLFFLFRPGLFRGRMMGLSYHEQHGANRQSAGAQADAPLYAAPRCTPRHTSTWPGAQAQWYLARSRFNITSRATDAVPPLEMPHVDEMMCSSTTHGGEVVQYLPVYKVNSALVCANIKTLHKSMGGDDGPITRSSSGSEIFTFTIVRDPISHFVSAYEEIVNRALTFERKKYRRCSRKCYTFVRKLHKSTPEKTAIAFMNDMLHGCIASPCCPKNSKEWYGGDLHILPQASFVRLHERMGTLGRLNFVGKLESVEASWSSIGNALPWWPQRLDTSADLDWDTQEYGGCDTHRRDCERPGAPHRSAMDSMLAKNSDVLLALCRILLPDYGCFRNLYSLPTECASVITDEELDLSCPSALKEAMADARWGTY